MADTANFHIAPVQDNVLHVHLNGEAFSFERAEPNVTVTALEDGDAVEQLRSSPTVDGRRVWMRDETGASATYSTSVRGELISTVIEVAGQLYKVEATTAEYPNELSNVLQGVHLPRLQRILRLTEEIKSNSEFRRALPGLGGAESVASLSADCQIACGLAVIPLSPGLQPFAAGYCAGCLLNG